MTEMFGEAWSPMSVPDLAPDDDDDFQKLTKMYKLLRRKLDEIHSQFKQPLLLTTTTTT